MALFQYFSESTNYWNSTQTDKYTQATTEKIDVKYIYSIAANINWGWLSYSSPGSVPLFRVQVTPIPRAESRGVTWHLVLLYLGEAGEKTTDKTDILAKYMVYQTLFAFYFCFVLNAYQIGRRWLMVSWPVYSY